MLNVGNVGRCFILIKGLKQRLIFVVVIVVMITVNEKSKMVSSNAVCVARHTKGTKERQKNTMVLVCVLNVGKEEYHV